MNLKTEFFLAWRYFQPKQNAVSIITCISIIGVSLGVGVLIVVIAVMTGFTDIMEEKLLETTAHLQIYEYGSNIKRPQSLLKKIRSYGVVATPIVMKHALIQKNKKFIPKIIIGIDPRDKTPMSLKNRIVGNNPQFSLNHGEIIVGKIIAQQNYWNVNDKIIIHSPEKISEMINIEDEGSISVNNTNKIHLPSEFKITGISYFDKFDFDEKIIFMNINDANELFDMPLGSASAIYAWTKDPMDMQTIIKKLKTNIFHNNYYLRTWKEMHQQLLSVLGGEKVMMFILLIFITLVAAFSITNTLITVVVQKTHEIGILKACGASSLGIMRVFIFQGFFVGVVGTIGGNIFGLSVIHWRNVLLAIGSKIAGRDLFPKEFYFFDGLPATIDLNYILFISITSLLLCTIGGIIPAIRAANLDPAKALRGE